MKISKWILAIWLTACAWAQAPPPKPKPVPQAAAKPSGGRSIATRHARRQRVEQRPSEHREVVPERRSVSKGQRDPFVSPLVERAINGANCTGSGRKCLMVGDVNLQGIVQYPGGYIAVVANGNHTHFLRENDPLADGEVERITKDAIIMRQRSSDILGRTLVREVTKKLGAPAA